MADISQGVPNVGFHIKYFIMKQLVLIIAAAFALASCVSEKTPEQKVTDLLTARFDSLALDCKVVSVALKDTLRSELTTADPGYKELRDKWYALMDARVDPSAPEYKAARQAMEEYEEAWVGEPVALSYTCIVECEEVILKAMIESGEFAIALDHSKILDLEK